MSDPSNHLIELEVYKNTFETWRFEVDSYWQRNTYFAAFETAAIAGCWYLLEKEKLPIGLSFAIFGSALTVIWFWNNVAVHTYIKYWWDSVKASEKALSLHDKKIAFASGHPGSNLHPSVGAKLVPLVFLAAWLSLVVYAVCHLCRCGK
jgi:hypothetical protein